MSSLLLVTEAVFVALFVSLLNYYYGNWKKQHRAVIFVSVVSWFLPILILFIIPVDISVVYYVKCNVSKGNDSKSCRSPWLYIDQGALIIFWHLVYWTSFCLTWIFLPILQSYAKSGAFTFCRKFKSALIDNAIYYGTYLLVVTFIGIYLLIHKSIPFDIHSIKLLIITATNTWGLLLVILFLGYGLVEVPRDLLRRSDTKKALVKAYYSIPKLNIDKLEEEEELQYLIRKGKHWSNQMSSSHVYRPYMDIILDKIEEAEGDLMQTADNVSKRKMTHSLSSGDLRSCDSDTLDENVKLKTLEMLHRSIKVTLHKYLRAHAIWEDMIRRAIWLEDVETNKSSGITYFRKPGYILHNPDSSLRKLKSKFEWYWKCEIWSVFLKIVAVVAAIVSILVVWSECTFWVSSPVLSLFARLLQLSAEYYNYFTINMVCFFSIGYLSLCTYSTVFRLKIFNYFRLVPNHHSDENSLIFCGMLLCRLTPPLCLNFLCLVHLDTHLFKHPNNTNVLPIETAYTSFMGHLDLVPLIANGFNLYFPLLVLILCICTLFRLGDKIMQFMGLKMLFGGHDDDIDSFPNVIEEGRLLLRRERQNYDKSSEYLTAADGRNDYRSTVIEMASRGEFPSNHHSEFVADTQTQKLLDYTSDDWTPVEYNEDFVQKDFRLTSNKTNLAISSRKMVPNKKPPSLIRKFWPL